MKLLKFIEWVITILLLIVTTLLLIGSVGKPAAIVWQAIAYAAAMAGLGFLACPATPLADKFPSWQRIGLVIAISYFF